MRTSRRAPSPTTRRWCPVTATSRASRAFDGRTPCERRRDEARFHPRRGSSRRSSLRVATERPTSRPKPAPSTSTSSSRVPASSTPSGASTRSETSASAATPSPPLTEEPLAESLVDGGVLIDAAGLVLAPGFVDLHAHGQGPASHEYQARDGVTTALELEWGVADVQAFLDSRRGKSLVNYGATINHGALRGLEIVPQDERADLEAAFTAASSADEPLGAERDAADRTYYSELPPERFPAMLEASGPGTRGRRPGDRPRRPVLPRREPPGDLRSVPLRRREAGHHPHPRPFDDGRCDPGSPGQRGRYRGAPAHRARQQHGARRDRHGARPDRRRAPPGARRDDGGVSLHGRLDQPPQLDLR